MFGMEIDTQVLLVERMWVEGFVGILNVDNEILQVAVRRTKAVAITGNKQSCKICVI
jgi:hypothetical protein